MKPSELEPAHHRHPGVEKHSAESRLFSQTIERFEAVGGARDGVTLILENDRDGIAEIAVILDEQHGGPIGQWRAQERNPFGNWRERHFASMREAFMGEVVGMRQNAMPSDFAKTMPEARPDFSQAWNLLSSRDERRGTMLLTLGVILLVVWLLGLVAFHVTSWAIHLVLVLAVILFLVHLVSGRRRVV